MGNSDCAVIGINDYFSVAGYKEVRTRLADPQQGADGNQAYRTALDKLRHKTLLPVIECRMTNVVIGKRAGSGQRINFHIIFSDELNADDIETFVKGIFVKDQTIGARYDDKAFLLNDAQADFNKVLERLKVDKTFKDKFVVWIPYDEYGGIGDIDPKTDKLFKEGLVLAADVLGSSNKKQSDFFLWKDSKYSEDEYRGWFGKRKPCIKGSDSHNVNEEIGRLKDHDSKPTDRCCWIKADPTFNGLRQIINEPEDRVFLGREPPKLAWIKDHRTYFLSRARIHKLADAAVTDEWFDCDLDLNHDMIAIIGNKGSGKSALADILALAGDTERAGHFSFLDKKKFREKKLASNFEVVATWADGSTTTHNLQDNPDPNRPEAIKYISQSYLETVCTETSADESSAFQHELRNVIFSHISEAQRLGKETLEELIEYKTEEINVEIARHKLDLSQKHSAIAALELKASPDFRLQVEEALKKKRQELEAHDAAKPTDVPKPDNLSEEQKAAYAAIENQLATDNAAVQAFELQITEGRRNQKVLAEQQSIAGKLEGRLSNIENEIKSQKQQSLSSFAALGLNVDDIITFKINRQPLVDKTAEIIAEKVAVDSKLNAELPQSLLSQHKAFQVKIDGLKNQLDAPSKRYQNYLQQLAAWQKRREEIDGSPDQPESLKFYEAQLKYIDEQLSADIIAAKASRRNAAVSIHACIAAIRNVYAELFDPVQKLIARTEIIKEGFKLSFASAIIQRGFRRDFFDRYISQGVNGSFCGKEPGEQRLTEIIEDFDFNDAEQAARFAEKIEEQLATDYRSSRKPQMQVTAQLRKHTSVKDFYDFLWSFGYLIPEYSLKLDGKDLVQLSPGERGVLLLVFYLLVDKSDCPIIVDQPEENLDNQTVYHLLIPVIKEVKTRRQIIMVTHNPNIAVVCDAEQVIHASIDRTHGNRITYSSGSIEDLTTNTHILNVLEGTRPAFDNRDGKYYRT
ncbi:MAG: hypothetical protein WAW96_12930 [Alphaproteobacteria bacterium]